MPEKEWLESFVGTCWRLRCSNLQLLTRKINAELLDYLRNGEVVVGTEEAMGRLFGLHEDKHDSAFLSSKPPVRTDAGVYEGQWNLLGERCGFGRFRANNGELYEGHWESNLQHGQGRVVYNDKTGYSGSWDRGKPNGYGRRIYPNGDQYFGTWANGMKQGLGSLQYTNGDVYVGEYKNGERHGKGCIFYATGERFVGGFHMGVMQGQALIYFPKEQSLFFGNFQDSKANGYGVQSWADGTRYEGEWKDWKQHGWGKMMYWKGVYEGGWSSALKNGDGVRTGDDGVKRRCYHQEGRLHWEETPYTPPPTQQYHEDRRCNLF